MKIKGKILNMWNEENEFDHFLNHLFYSNIKDDDYNEILSSADFSRECIEDSNSYHFRVIVDNGVIEFDVPKKWYNFYLVSMISDEQVHPVRIFNTRENAINFFNDAIENIVPEDGCIDYRIYGQNDHLEIIA